MRGNIFVTECLLLFMNRLIKLKCCELDRISRYPHSLETSLLVPYCE